MTNDESEFGVFFKITGIFTRLRIEKENIPINLKYLHAAIVIIKEDIFELY